MSKKKTKGKINIGVSELLMAFAVVLLILLIVFAKAFLTELGKVPGGVFDGKTEYPTLYKYEVTKASLEYGIEEERIYAVIRVESSFNPNSHSNADARGLMQMLPSTYSDVCRRRGEECDPELLYDPAVNIDACTYYLAWLYERLGNWDNVHIAYNAGIGNVLKWRDDPQYSKDGVIFTTPSKQANAYIERINYFYEEYKNCK